MADNELRLSAFETFQKAAAVAEAIGDKRALSYACGYEGELYEAEKKYDEALTLTRKALVLAQELKSPDAVYRWEWQSGRLLHAKHNDEAAIAAYRRAVETLQLIRHDVALRYGNPNAHSSFRDGRRGNVFFSSLTCYYSALIRRKMPPISTGCSSKRAIPRSCSNRPSWKIISKTNA